ncbi:MAG: Ig-like domain-containing protein [Tannerella sp.]|nr:Ig-like domain-containing protein [Tannerella sp.]
MLGLFVAALSVWSCNDENEVTVSGITVSPSTIPAMEVGETMELTAAITPDNATEDIRWEVYDNTVVSIESQDPRKAILKAVASGTTRIFATNKTGIVVSDEITVKVNSSEYAKFVVGNYSGTAEVRGALNVDLSGVQVKMERVAGEEAQVKLTLVAEVPGMGELTITGDQVTVSPVSGEPDTYAFKGRTASLQAPLNFPLDISGKYSATGKTLTLDLTADGLSIHVDATPGTPTDYGALVAGDYVGSAQVTGMMSVDLSNVQVTLARTGSSKVNLAITGEAPGLGVIGISGEDITVAAGLQPETCVFSGKASLPLPPGFELNVAGTFNTLTHTLTLTLAEVNGVININLEAMPPGFDPSNYAALVEGNYLGSAKLTGLMEADLNDVKIALERVDNETVKINLTADVPTLGEVTVAGDAIKVSEGTEANIFALSGTAAAALGEFSVTGTVNVTEHTLVVQLASDFVTIEVTAAKVEEEPPPASYAEIVAGNYLGVAKLSGAMNESLPNTPVKLEVIDGEAEVVKFTIEAEIPGMGPMTLVSEALAVAPGETANTYTLSGEVVLAALGNLPLTVTGTFDTSDQTLTLRLAADIVSIDYSGSRLAIED